MTGLEMLTGLTVDKGQMLADDDGIKYQSYQVIKQPNTGARQRINDYDLITIHLIPAHREMNFEPIKKMTGDAVERLKKETQSPEIKSKIQFLYAVRSLIDTFVVEQDIVNRTKGLLKEFFIRTHPDEAYLFGALAGELYDKLVDQQRMQEFIENNAENDCFSGCMTVRNALKFWCDPRSVSGRCDNRQTDIQCAIIRFLMSSKNSSDVERNFGVMKRNCHQNRPNLKSENWHNEAFLRELKRQNQIFIDLKLKDQSKKRDAHIRKV